MPTVASHVNIQYGYTIGRGEQFGPGFTTPVFAARGEGDLLYVLCRASEYRPEGTRITVCTVDEEYVTAFAKNWNVYVTDEWLNRISIFSKDGDYISKWQERPGSGDGELNRPSGLAIDADDNVYVVEGD